MAQGRAKVKATLGVARTRARQVEDMRLVGDGFKIHLKLRRECVCCNVCVLARTRARQGEDMRLVSGGFLTAMCVAWWVCLLRARASVCATHVEQ